MKIPTTGTEATQYVRLGFWQRNELTETRQDTLFSTFVYGFPTALSSMPKSGTGNFKANVFGLSAHPGFAPRSFQGRGNFDADFTKGIFQINIPTQETDLVAEESSTGGGLFVMAGGEISSSDASFSGDLVYGGSRGRIGGAINGRFFGPSGQELGAAFNGVNADGATVTGALTGQLNAGAKTSTALTLASVTPTTSFFAGGSILQVISGGASPGINPSATQRDGRLEYRNGDMILFVPGTSELPNGEWGPAQSVSSADPNFTAYRQQLNGEPADFQVYKQGAANSQLALTYSSMGRYATRQQSGVLYEYQQFFFYGINTPAQLLSGRTGTGTYAGVVIGAGANRRDGARYEISGSSRFDVDFTNQRIGGLLSFRGAQTAGGSSVDFGNYDFNAPLAGFGTDTSAGFIRGGNVIGNITTRFFGPSGQEIGGKFDLTVPDGVAGAGTNIAGVTLAKRQ